MTKVLYLSGATGADYMCDQLFHGLRSLLGPDCVDFNKLTFMYQGEPYPPFYSIYALLPDIEVDRDDISGKLEARYFDVVIYGSIQRFRDHFEGVQRLYPPNKIIFIDGEDDQSVLRDLRYKGIYFKRELSEDYDHWILPIEFCIPKEKIRPIDVHRKTRLMAQCDPRDRSTYQFYGNESAYYDQYSDAWFGYTMKKGGWDACRHYEIIAAGCLPYFGDLEACPKFTLFWLPKNLLQEAKIMHDNWASAKAYQWIELMVAMQEELKKHLTTEAMAKYVLEQIK